MGSETHSLRGKVSWFATSSILATVSRFYAGIVVARLLEQNIVGRIALIIWVIETCNLVISLGTPAALNHFLAASSNSSHILTLALKWLAGTIAIQSFATVSISKFLDPQLTSGELALIAIIGACSQLNAASAAALSGLLRFRQLAIVSALSFCIVVTTALPVVRWYGLSGGLVVCTFQSLLGAALCTFHAFRRQQPISTVDAQPDRRRFFAYALDNWGAAVLSSLVWSRTELVFLEAWLGSASVAVYSVALAIPQMVSQSAQVFGGSLTTHFSQLSGSSDKGKTERHFALSIQLIACVVFPLSFLTAVVCQELLSLLYGEKFAEATEACAILCIGAICNVGVASSGLVYGVGKSRFVLVTASIGAALHLGLLLTLLPGIGLLGVAIIRVSIQCMLVLGGLIYVHLGLRVAVPFSGLAKLLFSSLLAAGLAAAIRHLHPTQFGAAIAFFAGMAGYLILIRVTHALTPEAINAVINICGRIHPSLKSLAGSAFGAQEH